MNFFNGKKSLRSKIILDFFFGIFRLHYSLMMNRIESFFLLLGALIDGCSFFRGVGNKKAPFVFMLQ